MQRHDRTQVDSWSGVIPTALPTCSVVVPVHDQAGLTRQCLDAVFASPRSGCESDILVVDDASTDATPDLLATYGERIRVVREPANAGFAQACNDGAAATTGEYVVFLNNDTIPEPGWLDALVHYADLHPDAAVVGAKLLFPNDTIQHAGVVIGQDRYPRHLYAGFPRDHPCVNRSRRFQIVTGACLLVRRSLFEELGGFDTAFRNGYEDVDFCLRCGERGLEVHYCHDSVVYHLEAASRGRRHDESTRAYERRWKPRVRPDDVQYYLDDGLLRFTYGERYPIGVSVSPALAAGITSDDDEHRDDLLRARSREVAELLRETTRLNRLLLEAGVSVPVSGSAASEQLRRRIRAAVHDAVPRGATTLVVSRGDEDLLRLEGRRAWHFPQDEDGGYAGWYPPDSAGAVAHLEALSAKGADFLVVPQPAFWWLDHYAGFRDHLEQRCRVVLRDPDVCVIVALR